MKANINLNDFGLVDFMSTIRIGKRNKIQGRQILRIVLTVPGLKNYPPSWGQLVSNDFLISRLKRRLLIFYITKIKYRAELGCLA